MHVGLFAGFGALWMAAFSGPLLRRAGHVGGWGLLLAGATEVLQALLPIGRTASLLDALADALGLLLAAGGFVLAIRLRRRGKPASPARPPGEK